MREIEKVQGCVSDYHKNYRNPALEPLSVNRLYDLQGEWLKNDIPDTERPGVYVFYDEDKNLLYIGKASWNSTVGARIASYFKKNPETAIETLPSHNWTRDPKYVQTIPVERAFEASSLEEYLITTLRPVDNTLK